MRQNRSFFLAPHGVAPRTYGAFKTVVVDRVRFVVVCYSAKACELLGVRARAGSDHQAAQSSTAQAEIVGCLGGTDGAGAALGKTGPSF